MGIPTAEDLRKAELSELCGNMEGDVFTDDIHRKLYSTDASVYKELPWGVAFPKTEKDLKSIVDWSFKTKIPLIPRTAGTSLAGQVVGSGLVVDTGRYLNKIISIDPEKRRAVVQPGVIRDELNRTLKPYGLFFAPETSSSNRCMIGGMVGNNACGARSMVYGSTRDHLLEVKGFLANGEPVVFGALRKSEFSRKCELPGSEGEVYRFLNRCAVDDELLENIRSNVPWPEIRRRNTGYAIDELLGMYPFDPDGDDLNLAKLIAGSEGTLMMISELTLNLIRIPTGPLALVCVHCHTLEEAFHANLIVLKHPVLSVELIDKVVLTCTIDHPGFQDHRFFIRGNPEAVLIIEIQDLDERMLQSKADAIIHDLMGHGYGYHYPVIMGDEMNKVWELRKAGLGLLSNVKGEARPVPVTEDTAVRPADLPAYMSDFRSMLEQHGLSCVYYAHIGTGELHLRPVLNLKNPEHKLLFRELATQTAALVKKYRGSLSGEHGDGRLRGEFIHWMVGDTLYQIFLDIKDAFDPDNMLNPGKIIATPPMDTSLRYDPPYHPVHVAAMFRSYRQGGLLNAIERCNGSGDCRRPASLGGVMCPSYQATGDERYSTRGRADFLRETIACSENGNPYADRSMIDLLSFCLSCKGCKKECPGSVDMASIKAEILNSYYQHHTVPLSVWMMGNIYHFNKWMAMAPSLFNRLMKKGVVANLIRRWMGIHPKRSLPMLSVPTMNHWLRKNRQKFTNNHVHKRRVVFLVDEFTRFYDADIGIKAIKLLLALGYEVIPFTGLDSGRAALSLGLLNSAKKYAENNVSKISRLVHKESPLVGLEPSSLLVFRDEYMELVSDDLLPQTHLLSSSTLLLEEFLSEEFRNGNIAPELFSDKPKTIVFHGHCHQKALADSSALKEMLEIPVQYSAREIKSGCCGMAGTFGMMKEHYDMSMMIGEMNLFPTIRNLDNGIVVATAGTGCRMQLRAGTGKEIYHPVEILYQALRVPKDSSYDQINVC